MSAPPGRTAGAGRGDFCFTPRWLVELVEELVDGIDTDPAHHPDSHVRPRLVQCSGGVGGFDGLTTRWRGSAWVNPPYSKPGPWVAKCEAHARTGESVLLLLKADPSTKWFEGIWRADVRVFFSSRLKFDGYGEGRSAPFPSVLATWNVDPDLIRAAFSDVGHIA